MAKMIGYCRVSTAEQSAHGHSLAAQQAKIESYAALYDLELIEVVTDAGQSAATLDRPGLQKVLSLLKSGKADGVIVAKLDRLTRDIGDLSTLLKKHFKKAALHSVAEQLDTKSANGRMVLNLLGTVSQWEREAIGERTSVTLQHMKAQRLRIGRVPFGMRLAPDGRHLEECPEEQAILRMIASLKARGMSVRQIAAELNRLNIQNRDNTPWTHMSIYRVSANCK